MTPSLLLKKRLCLALSASSLVVLAACGGGGGGSDAGTAADQAAAQAAATAAAARAAADAAANAAAQAAIVAAAPPSSYAAGSEERAAFNLLNFERGRCGFGQLTQNLQLDAAAKSHADYQIINNVLSHVQNRTTNPAGFTGVNPLDRVLAQGYTSVGGVTDEIVGLFGTDAKAGTGASGVRGLLSAPYHLRGLVAGYRDVGLSVRSSTDLGTRAPTVILQLNAAYKAAAGPQLQGSGEVNTYPCEGTTGVNRQLANESPNPIPGRDLAVNPLGGVVYVGLREGNVLRITNVAMTQVSTGRSIALRAPVTAANDPYSPCLEGCFKPHQAYVAADAPLQANSAFQVVLNGTNNGTPFSRSFVFSTGAGG